MKTKTCYDISSHSSWFDVFQTSQLGYSDVVQVLLEVWCSVTVAFGESWECYRVKE